MQVKQVAELLGVDKKEVIDEVENHREVYLAQGYKLAKKLNASSALDESVVRQILASFDLRRQKAIEREREEQDRREREELERRRAADELKRKEEEEKRRAAAEAAHKAAEAELKRRQMETARRQEEARRLAEQQAAAAAAEPPAPAQPQAPVADARPAAPQTPAAPHSAPSAQSAPQAPTSPIQRPAAPQAPRAPSSRWAGQQSATQARGDSSSAPAMDGSQSQQPPQGRPQGPRSDDRPRPQTGRDGRPRPPAGRDDRQRPRTGTGERPSTGDRTTAGRPPRDGQQRGGPRHDGPPRRKDETDGRPARAEGIEAFVKEGIGSEVENEIKRPRRGRVKPKESPKKDREWTDGSKPRRKPATETDNKKRFRPSQIFNIETVDERRIKQKRRTGGFGDGEEHKVEKPKAIALQGDFTVGEFAEKIHVPINQIMGKLLLMGRMLTINHLLDPDLAEELALEYEIDVEVRREDDDIDISEYVNYESSDEDMRPRPPIVTVMGHVDHGKTSLLDRIRKEDVAAHEFGGITQHIGAYLVSTPSGDIVFLDTPGHEAFTEMRSRGANVTDLVILVVAANDGVMPQTIEAINHAKAAGVRILVAVNKIDAPGANPDRVMQDLMRFDLVPEKFGGDTVMIPVSATTGEGVDELLELIALQTELLELKANPNRPAVATVIESHVDPTRGAVATVLVQEGTLHLGDCFVVGTEVGRVRAMRDDRDNQLDEAGPARPVEILGLRGSPTAGEIFAVVPSESAAREIAERRNQRRRIRKGNGKTQLTLDNLAEQMTEGEVINLNLILKADVQGSLEAVSNALLRIKSDKVLIRILHAAVGAVNVSDVQLADASGAIILSFNVTTDPVARDAAEELHIDIRSYQIIYALLEDIEKAMIGMLKPEYDEKEEGRTKVLQIFKVSKIGTIAGCFVEEGSVAIDHRARLVRNGSVVWRGKLRSLRRVKDNVKLVQSGLECGIGLENFNDIKEGDIIETFSMVQQEITLVSSDTHKKPAESVS